MAHIWEKYAVSKTLQYIDETGSFTGVYNTNLYVFTEPFSLVDNGGAAFVGSASTLTTVEVNGVYASIMQTNLQGKYVATESQASRVYHCTTVASADSNNCTVNYDRVCAVVDGGKGDYIGTVEDANSAAYPVNGAQGGYWYIYIGEGSSSGLFATTNGVQKKLSAVPAMVDGVLRELDSLYSCVDGVMREIFSSKVQLLPAGYTQLAYVKSSGTQYFDLGFKPNQNTRIVLDIQLLTTTGTKFIFNSRGGSAQGYKNPFGVLVMSGTYHSDYGTSNAQSAGVSTDRMIIDKNKTSCKIGSLTLTNTANTFQSAYNLLLLASPEGGTPGYFCDAIVYSCHVYDNDTLVRNLVPCIDQNGDVGLYDLVYGEFYGNAGTGEFTGKAPAQLPEGYTLLDYIKSSGTQYINTKFKPNQNTKVEVTYQTAASSNGIVAADHGWLNNCFGIYVNTAAFGSTNCSITPTTNKRTVVLDKGVLVVDGATHTTMTGTFQTSYPLSIFALNRSGSIQEYTSMKLYSCRIYDNGTPVRDYVPCKNLSGEVGLYDLVYGEFYGNAGTDSFIAGAVISGGSDSSTISFTIDGVTYEAESGMTWAEWVESGYNTGEFLNVYSTVCEPTSWKPVQDPATGTNVALSSVITSGCAYYYA